MGNSWGGKRENAGRINELMLSVRGKILEVFNRIQEDESQPYSLLQFAKDDPKTFYLIASKLVPQEMILPLVNFKPNFIMTMDGEEIKLKRNESAIDTPYHELPTESVIHKDNESLPTRKEDNL